MDTSKNSDINIVKYKGFDSLYDTVDEYNWVLKNTGFDYENNLMEVSTSPYLQRNPTMKAFFPYLNKMLSHLINSVKYLRNFNNYAVRKDYKYIN